MIENDTNPIVPSGLSDIISIEEINKFHELLPKIQKANIFLESLNNPEPEYVRSPKDRPTPYTVEINVSCTVSEHPNDMTSSPTIVEKQNKIYQIDFIVSNYLEFLEKFYDNVTESLTQTCNTLYHSLKSNESKE